MGSAIAGKDSQGGGGRVRAHSFSLERQGGFTHQFKNGGISGTHSEFIIKSTFSEQQSPVRAPIHCLGATNGLEAKSWPALR